VMLGFNVFGADTLSRAKFLATSMQQAFVNLRSGRPSQLQPPANGYVEGLEPQERAILDQVLSCASIGTVGMVRADLQNFIQRTQANELMITSQIYDHAARLRSFEIAAEALSS
jgi:alkanesulfonate monooxygenase SsuD/methylene tetrahydromethanopterin reductase-like flavin-dependent oxidoreductase (luciferase family)